MRLMDPLTYPGYTTLRYTCHTPGYTTLRYTCRIPGYTTLRYTTVLIPGLHHPEVHNGAHTRVGNRLKPLLLASQGGKQA